MNTQSNGRNTAQTQTLMTRTYKIMKAAQLLKANEDAAAIMHTFGENPARRALVNATYKAFQEYMDENEELYDAQASIRNAINGL